MKKLIIITLLTIISAVPAFAQNKTAEQELLKFNADYLQAIVNRDVAYFERTLADDYVFSIDGMSENKAGTLAYYKQEKTNPTVKLISLKQEDMKTKVIGETAILTGKWITTIGSLKDDKTETHIDNGRYTLVLEKRKGNWLVVTEHNSEAPHNRKSMEQEVMKASQNAVNTLKSNDITAFERILTDEYLYTNGEGKSFKKTEVLARYKSGDEKIESAEISDQKVHIIGNNSAVETGTIKLKGSYKGNQYAVTEQYTTTWVWRKEGWQIIADHVSAVK